MGLSLRNIGRKLWETVTPQNEQALRNAEANLNRANQAMAQPAKYGVLRNPQVQRQAIQNNQAVRFNAPKVYSQVAGDVALNTFAGGVKRFGQDVAGAVLSPYSNYMASQERERAIRLLKPSYENMYRAYGADPRLGANQAEIEAGQADYSIRTDPLTRSGIGVNDSRATVIRKVGAHGAEAALDIATAGQGPAAFKAAKLGKTVKPSIAVGAATGAGGNLAYTAGQEGATTKDYLISGLTGAATGAVLPALGAVGGKLNKAKLPKSPTTPTQKLSKADLEKRNELVSQLAKAELKPGGGNSSYFIKKIKALDERGSVQLPGGKDPLESLKQEAKPATGARSDYSPENLQANRQIRAKNASSITYADKKTINPDELVTVYRAVPGKAKGGLVEGDWVTPNKEQARLFMKQSWAQDDTGAKIVTKRVKASELRYHADDAKGYVDDELLYVPKQKELLKSSTSNRSLAANKDSIPQKATQPPKSPQGKSKVALKEPAQTQAVKKPKVSAKRGQVDSSLNNTPKTSIDPNDPFGNSSIIKRIKNELGSKIDDDSQMIALLRKVEKETGRTGLVDQWYFDTGNVRTSAAIANAKLKNSADLQEAFQGLSKQDLDNYDAYAAARAELRNYEGLRTSKEKAELEAIVAQGDADFGAGYAAQNNYYKTLAQDMYDGGLISKEQLDNYVKSDDYIRIQRDMEDLVGGNFGGSRSRSIGSTTAGQKRKGSSRDILSPSRTTFQRAQQIELEIQRNKAATSTINLLEELGLAREVKNSTNKNTISKLVDGKKMTYEVPGDIKKVMDNISPYNLGIVAQILSAPTRMFRAGTTALSVPFTVTNYLRDQASSAIYSKQVLATHNPKNIIQGLASATRDTFGESQHPLWKKFEMFAGDQTVFDELRNAKNSKRLMREITQGEGGKLKNMVTSPVRTLEDLNSITERATRFQNFKGTYEAAIKEGLSDADATKKAVLAARQNSVDFNRSSSFTRTANLFIPYFNASVQGSRNVARSFRDRPLSTSMKSIGFVALPAVAATMYNYSDENRRKVYESINEFEKEDNIIIVGPNPKQRADGGWEGVYKIPKPQGYRELVDPVRDMTEAFVKNEPVEDVAGMFKDMLGGLTGPVNIESQQQFIGGLIPQQVKPTLQSSINQDLYSGNKIVPEYMIDQTEDPTKRAYKSTSGSARLVANALGTSPIQVEKFISDTAGSIGRYGLNAVDNALAKAGKIPEEQIGGRSMAKDFSRRLFEASGETLEENKTPGQKYYETKTAVIEKFKPNSNERAAYETLHPNKKNFLGEDIFDENKRISKYTKAGIYLNHPKVFEMDKEIDAMQRAQGKPGNPLYELKGTQLNKVLLKQALPPGASDPELDKLYEQDWYQDYQTKNTLYYEAIKESMAKQGKTMPKSDNPYPDTPKDLQAAMTQYSSLPKGTGARSAWIKANPGAWQAMTNQWAAIDAWENNERVKIGLNPITNEQASGGSGGYSRGYGGYGGSGGSRTKSAGSKYKYAVSLNAGGSFKAPKVSVKNYKTPTQRVSTSKPKVSIKKSLV